MLGYKWMSFGTKGAKMNPANAMQREITEE